MNRFAIDGPRPPTFPRAIIHPLGPVFRYLPLRLRRHLLHARAHGTWGNFDRPVSWSEKMQWRILNDRRAFLGVSCDKLASKEYARRETLAAGLQLRIPARARFRAQIGRVDPTGSRVSRAIVGR